MIARKAALIDQGLALHGAHLKDPLEILRRFGGREFAAIAGAILAARMEKVPVVLDGFSATAAAAILHRANPAALDHCLLSHVPAEPGHRKAIDRLGLKPLLDLGLQSRRGGRRRAGGRSGQDRGAHPFGHGGGAAEGASAAGRAAWRWSALPAIAP